MTSTAAVLSPSRGTVINPVDLWNIALTSNQLTPRSGCFREAKSALGLNNAVSQYQVGPNGIPDYARHAHCCRCATLSGSPATIEAMPKIITVAAAKGGVGKTTLAYEVACLLDAPLVDLDWDEGGATRRWGYRHEERVRSSLLDALENGRVPTPLAGHGRKPDLIAGHPDFASQQPDPEDMAELLTKWAAAWGRPYVVVDTHPGAAHAGHGAMLAASVVVVPVILATNELNALEGTLKEVPDYPLLLILNKVPRAVPRPELRRLRRLVEVSQTQVGPVVPFCRSLETRKRHSAVTSEEPVPAVARDVVAGLRKVADAVRSYTRD